MFDTFPIRFNLHQYCLSKQPDVNLLGLDYLSERRRTTMCEVFVKHSKFLSDSGTKMTASPLRKVINLSEGNWISIVI